MNNSNGKYDRGRYTTIPETKNIKLPIGGKIRLGVRVKNEQGVEYPSETDYFVCPKEVKNIYGDEPTELTVFFPVAKREKVFPQSYEKYGSNEALLCQGDGDVSKTAQRLNLENGRWEEVKCPCEHYGKYDKKTKIGGCAKAGYLKFMMPSVSIGTFYQCRVGGTVSIEECNSAFELADKTTGGCWAMIPFRMKRVAKKLKIPGTAKMKTHWVVTLEIAASTEEIRRVIAGEILYLGQQRNKQYELETIEPAKQENEREVITQEELEREEQEEAEVRGITVKELREMKKVEEVVSKQGEKEDLKREYNASKAKEAELEKERAEGKHKVKPYQESKALYEKKQEEKKRLEKQEDAGDFPLNEWPDKDERGEKEEKKELPSLKEEKSLLDLIGSRAKDVGINSLEELVDFAVEKGIFQTPLAEKLALKVLATNKEVVSRLFKAFKEIPEPKKEVLKEETEVERFLASLLNKAKKAGKTNWNEIIYEGCRHRMPNGKYIFEIDTSEKEAKEILIHEPERYKKLEEAFTAIIESGGE